jgi:hypothetical protein
VSALISGIGYDKEPYSRPPGLLTLRANLPGSILPVRGTRRSISTLTVGCACQGTAAMGASALDSWERV